MPRKNIPARLSQAAFARHIGKARSWVTQLKSAGRLVMTDDGRHVLVAESIERISQTEDPNRSDVKGRHARGRGAQRKNGESKAAKRGAGAGKTPPKKSTAKKKSPAKKSEKNIPGSKAEPSIDTSLIEQRKVKEHYLGLQAKADYEKSIGKLVELERVRLGGMDIAAHVRQSLENMPDQLAPLLAPEKDKERCHSMLVDAIEQVLIDMADNIKTLVESDED